MHLFAEEQKHLVFYLDMLMKTGSESIEAIMRRQRVLFAGFVGPMDDTRLPECAKNWWGVRAAWGSKDKS